MEPIVEEFTITLKYQVKVDTETGEMSTKCISRKVDKSNFEVAEDKSKRKTSKSKKDESSEPTLTLEDNKYYLNQAAVDLMGVEPDCKLDIKYEKRGKETVPVIGTDESFGTHSGNRVTKSFTVAYRGSKREELSKYGTEFILVPHETKDGIFILQNENAKLEQALDDTIEKLDEAEEEIELPMDIDLQDLIDDKDATITEVSSSMFQL